MDMRKEIKLSDLFKRKPKQDDVEMETTDPTEPAEKKPSRFTLTRKKSEDAEPKEPKAPKAPKEPRRKKSAKGAGPALADVPLMRAFNLMPKDAASGADTRRVNPARLGIAVAALVVFALLASMFLIANARVADKSDRAERSEGPARRARRSGPGAGRDAVRSFAHRRARFAHDRPEHRPRLPRPVGPLPA